MAKMKAPLEIRKAKQALEQHISDILFEMVARWHNEHTDWLVTDVDLSVIDISTKNEQRRMTATALVELTRKDLKVKITKSGKVKEIE